MSAAEAYAREPVRGQRGMVVSGHPLATAAGLHVLMDGGNAVDAAIAASAVLAVVRPAWCGLGGDGFALLYRPASGVVALNGGGAAPLAVTPGAYPDGHVPLHGPRSVTVPGLVGAWELAASTHGSRSLGDLLQLAIQYARNGFVVDPAFSQAIEQIAPRLDHWPSLANLLVQDGHLLRAGDVLRQPSLAETLAVIATQGRQAFYRGTIALALVESLVHRGGLLTLGDFARHSTIWQAPISAPYREYTVYEQPVVSQGFILLQELTILAGFGVRSLGRLTPELVDLLVRCKQAAFADAARYLPAVKGRGDAAAAADTLERLLSPKRAATWQTFIAARGPAAATLLATGGTDTDCLVVADGDGRLICWIQSLANPFGAREVCPTTGIILNDRLAGLPLDPEQPHSLSPGRVPWHTLNNFMVCREGQPVLAGATPGGQGQLQLNLQFVVNAVDFGLDVQAAVDAPRWISGSEVPGDETLYLESHFPAGLADELTALGHTVVNVDGGQADERFGNATLIGLDPTTRVLSGAMDFRRDAHALGW
jgi:gamma-glutamyltranspeptidase / glutathione hydrolase